MTGKDQKNPPPVEDPGENEETAYLLSIQGMRESIQKGLATPIEETSEEPGW